MFEILNLTTWKALLDGLLVTLEISIVSILFSLVVGLALGILMSFKNRFIFILCRSGLEIIRVMPLIVWLFIVNFGLATWFGFEISAITASIIVFSIWGAFEMMDLVRGSLASIPKHQFEAGLALGLTKLQTYIYVILPQAMRRLIPASINLLSRMIKSTSITILIGVVELIKVGQQTIEFYARSVYYAPFIIYGLIFFIYFLLCYPISWYSQKLEKKWR